MANIVQNLNGAPGTTINVTNNSISVALGDTLSILVPFTFRNVL